MIKKKLIYILPIVLVIAGFAIFPFKRTSYDPVDAIPAFTLQFKVNDSIIVLKPQRKNVSETVLITQLLNAYHYGKVPLSDSLSAAIYHNYLDALDHSKLYFLKSDINGFDRYRLSIDDSLKRGSLSVPYQIFAVFKQRYYERLQHVDALLEKGFDFTKDEYFKVDRDSVDWLSTPEKLDETWRKYVKNEMLSLKLSGKSDSAAVSVLKKRYKRFRTIIQQYKSEDVYQVFMNSFTEALDPHTSYFSPITAENFDIEMSKSLEGIGARLSKDGDYTIVVSVVPGGPAFKSNLIHENDKIVGVAQGDAGEMVDVVGWRNDDVVQLIRGKKGTVVRLNVLKAEDGASAMPFVVRIVRDKINLEDARAESKVVSFKHEGKPYTLGVITIPSFYKNFKDAREGDKEYNSTTRDVKKLITDLKEKHINGLLIDLRRNGGGALDEAIELTGLFIKNGPVVQVKDFGGRIEEENDESGSVFYDGPLTILTSRLSASASEIFSAAIQDYKRGLIVGEQTFGKGTVQNLLSLQRFIPKEKDKLGQLKLTMAKYYRVNGGSTQNIGVKPDLKLPSEYDAQVYGESTYPSAMPYDKIKSSSFRPVNDLDPKLIAELNKRYNERLKTDKGLQELVETAKEMRENRNIKEISLNETKRLEKHKKDEERRKSLQKMEGQVVNTETGTSEDSGLNLKDQYLKEGLLILADMVAIKDA